MTPDELTEMPTSGPLAHQDLTIGRYVARATVSSARDPKTV